MRVLGDLAVDGLDIQSVADRKARLLLHVLALARGRAVPAVALADVLWPVAAPARPVDQVAVLASRLRRALGRDAIEHLDGGYRLRYRWLDVDELATLVAEVERRRADGDVRAAAAAARAALSLVRGPLATIPGDIDWVRADEAAVERLVVRARSSAANALLGTGDWLDAVELAGVNLQQDPFDEDAVRIVMRANALADRPAAALAAYARFRETLADELGADPASETTAVHTAILRGELAAPARPHGVVLVGRDAELARLDRAATDALRGERASLVSVQGEPGIGKSTLLHAWADARRERGDAVLVGTCGPLERSAPLDVLLASLAEALRGRTDATRLLNPHAALLEPLLGLEPTDRGRVALEAVLGPEALYAALTDVVRALGAEHGTIVVLDDAHLAGAALAEWTRFVVRRPLPLLVVVGVRPGEGQPYPATDHIELEPLDRAAAAALVGEDRADELHRRSGGHPLFLLALAEAEGDELPPSLLDAVTSQCAALGDAAGLVRAAAVLGPEIDVELVAGTLDLPVLDVLAAMELAEARRLLVPASGRYSFRHELVREALAANTPASRAALLHREAARHLQQRPDADPLQVAEHARLGGEIGLAAEALHAAALRAAERFDHQTAEDLLDQSLRMRADDCARLARARVRILRERYDAAEVDAVTAAVSRPEGWEVAAWAAYFARRFGDAIRYAADGEAAATDPVQRSRCLVVAGRTLHARGDLADAERRLAEATRTATGADRVTATAWLGILESHRSRPARALELLRPATFPGLGPDQTSAALHAQLFTGHAHAVAGRPRAALEAFARYTREVERRQVPRFGGRGSNFTGWVLRNLGHTDAGVEAHLASLECADADGTPEVRVAALEDLAEERLDALDLDRAARFLDQAEEALVGDLVFGWRLAMRLALLRTRLALLAGRAEDALGVAGSLDEWATRVEVPRYAATARLLRHRAAHELGEPVDGDQVRKDVAAVESAMALEAWWWAGDTGSALGLPDLVARAEALAAALAEAADEDGDGVRAAAARRLAGWRVSAR